MLRTGMWTVIGESDVNGMEYGTGDWMLNIKFPDYAYIENVQFNEFSIEPDTKYGSAKVNMIINGKSYQYEKNDFYQFVPGTIVNILVDKENEILLSIIPTGKDSLVHGKKEDIDLHYDDLLETDYDYVYAKVEGKKLVSPVILKGESIFIDSITEKSSSVIINKKTYEDDVWDYAVILKDNERISLRDAQVGDILTTVTIYYNDEAIEQFYVVGGQEVKGRLAKYVQSNYESSSVSYVFIEVGGIEYQLDKYVTYVENPEDSPIKAINFYNNYNEKMKGEEVIIRLDPIFNKAVRVEFDGSIDNGAEKEKDVRLLGITSPVERIDSKTYAVTLADDTGEKEYVFATGAGNVLAEKLYNEEVEGYFAIVTLNEDGEIEDVILLARVDEEGGRPEINAKVSPEYDSLYTLGDEELWKIDPSGDNAAYYGYRMLPSVSYQADEQWLENVEKNVYVGVYADTVVVKLEYDTSLDNYVFQFERGLNSIEKLKEEDVIQIWYSRNDVYSAKTNYIILFEENNEVDRKVGFITRASQNIINAKYMDIRIITSDGDREDVIDKDKNELKENDVIVYTTEEKDDELFLKLVSKITDISSDRFAYVSQANGTRVIIDGEIVNYGTKDNQDKYKDYILVEVEVEEDGNVMSVMKESFTDISFNDFDRISIDEDNEVFYIIRGLGEIDDEAEVCYTLVDGEEVTQSNALEKGTTIALIFDKTTAIENAIYSPKKEGYQLIGWKDANTARVYTKNTTIKMERNITLIALWEKESVALKGDINADGKLSLIDVRLLLQKVVNSDYAQEEVTILDYNEDGKVSLMDVRLLLQKVVNG